MKTETARTSRARRHATAAADRIAAPPAPGSSSIHETKGVKPMNVVPTNFKESTTNESPATPTGTAHGGTEADPKNGAAGHDEAYRRLGVKEADDAQVFAADATRRCCLDRSIAATDRYGFLEEKALAEIKYGAAARDETYSRLGVDEAHEKHGEEMDRYFAALKALLATPAHSDVGLAVKLRALATEYEDDDDHEEGDGWADWKKIFDQLVADAARAVGGAITAPAPAERHADAALVETLMKYERLDRYFHT